MARPEPVRTFSAKQTFSEYSYDGPALAAFQSRRFIGWTGTESHLNVMS